MESNPDLTGTQWRKSSYSSDTGGECLECAPLGAVQWRKSSHSGDHGGDCVECAPLGDAQWAKSSYSGDTGGNCLEAAAISAAHASVAVRDSKDPHGPALTFTPAAFAEFVSATARGEFG